MIKDLLGGFIFCAMTFFIAFFAQMIVEWFKKDRRIPPPLCENCKYAEYVRGWTAEDGSHYFCKRYKSPVNDLSFMCWNVRDKENWCGYKGRGFEPKEK